MNAKAPKVPAQMVQNVRMGQVFLQVFHGNTSSDVQTFVIFFGIQVPKALVINKKWALCPLVQGHMQKCVDFRGLDLHYGNDISCYLFVTRSFTTMGP